MNSVDLISSAKRPPLPIFDVLPPAALFVDDYFLVLLLQDA